MVGQAHDVLPFQLMAHLGAAQHNFDVRVLCFQQSNHGTGLHHVPDVNAKTDDGRSVLPQRVHHVLRLAADGEFTQPRLGLQVTHVGQQVTQAQRRMDVFGIQRAQGDGRRG